MAGLDDLTIEQRDRARRVMAALNIDPAAATITVGPHGFHVLTVEGNPTRWLL